MTQTANNLAAYIWSLADLLRGDFKLSQYGRVILPFTLLRRLEGVLAESKEAVLAEYEKVRKIFSYRLKNDKLNDLIVIEYEERKIVLYWLYFFIIFYNIENYFKNLQIDQQ